MSTPQCSELFERVFDSGCCGNTRTCQCGVIHFDSYNNCDWGKGELEQLQEAAAVRPGLYVEHDCAVGTMSINGTEIVYGCTCKLAARWEQFIKIHASQLARYLNGLAQELRKTADNIAIEEGGGD